MKAKRKRRTPEDDLRDPKFLADFLTSLNFRVVLLEKRFARFRAREAARMMAEKKAG